MNNNDERFVGQPGDYKFRINGSSQNIADQLEARRIAEEQEGSKKYMPIGSVVQLGDSTSLKMIIGFKYMSDDREYDYLGCIYPFGLDSNHGIVPFQHEQIARIYHVGYINSQERNFKSSIGNGENYGASK